MIYIVILSITVLFFVFTLIISPLLKRYLGIRLCAICAASSTTWLTLLVFKTTHFLDVDETLLGVLFGGSVVGIMYALRDKYKELKLRDFWIIRVLWVPWGFYLAYAVAKSDSFMIKIGLLVTFLISLLILRMFKLHKKNKSGGSTKKKKEDAVETDREKQDAIKKLERSLEDCC
ncbi:MAG: hypothetical protein PHS44_01815 [Candidatus Dojkabacteria bacterium]|nr:hypothetical protein [Candidatus Dojkabacteria bacterium]